MIDCPFTFATTDTDMFGCQVLTRSPALCCPTSSTRLGHVCAAVAGTSRLWAWHGAAHGGLAGSQASLALVVVGAWMDGPCMCVVGVFDVIPVLEVVGRPWRAVAGYMA